MGEILNKYRWREDGGADAETVHRLAESLDIPHAGARFLAVRSYATPEAAQRFLFPGESPRHDPFLFDHMERAVAAVRRAIDSKSRILIHGDYDVDGICGTGLLYHFLRGLVPHVFRFLPDRRKDGYGIAERAVQWAIENHVGLVIAVDSGTSDGPLIERLLSRRIDVVICDHHELPVEAEVPGILLNPARPQERYPFKNLCGTAVAFKLICALETRGAAGATDSRSLLDLVALATVGDLAPLVDENRSFVREGLSLMNRDLRAGIRALKETARLDTPEITAYHLGYVFAPRINAPGRISNPKPALEILCARESADLANLASTIESDNRRRKEMTEIVGNEVMRTVVEMDEGGKASGFVVAGSGWEEGVLGIVAARIVDEFGKPAVLIAVDGVRGKGSGRSVPGIHLKEHLDRCAQHLIKYGGHSQAVGFSIEASRIDAFRDALLTSLRDAAGAGPFRPELVIDSDLGLDEVSMDLVEFLTMCEPFGLGNRRPVWKIPQVKVTPETRFVGRNHLKIFVQDAEGRTAEGISFRWNRAAGPEALHGKTVDLAVKVRKGYYLERFYPEMHVLDVRECR